MLVDVPSGGGLIWVNNMPSLISTNTGSAIVCIPARYASGWSRAVALKNGIADTRLRLVTFVHMYVSINRSLLTVQT